MDYSIAIWAIQPSKRYNIISDGYDGIIWQGDAIPEIELNSAYVGYLNSTKKAELRKLIVSKSEEEKAKYITNTSGKVFAYDQKRRETVAYGNGERDPANLPTMNETAIINNTTLANVYAEWSIKIAEWPEIGGRIEAKYDFQMSKLLNASFVNDADVVKFIDDIDLLGVDAEIN